MATLDDLVVELHQVADQFNGSLREAQSGVEDFARAAETHFAAVERSGASLSTGLADELGQGPDGELAIAPPPIALPDLGQLKEVSAELQRSGIVARQLGLTMASAFEAAIVKGKSLSDTLRGLALDVLQIMARKLVTEPLAGLITGSLSGFALPGFAQGGFVPAGLPELPGGGSLARVHEGELILTPAQQAALFSGRGAPTINLTVQAAAGASAADARRTGRQILSVLRDQLAGLDAGGS